MRVLIPTNDDAFNALLETLAENAAQGDLGAVISDLVPYLDPATKAAAPLVNTFDPGDPVEVEGALDQLRTAMIDFRDAGVSKANLAKLDYNQRDILKRDATRIVREFRDRVIGQQVTQEGEENALTAVGFTVLDEVEAPAPPAPPEP